VKTVKYINTREVFIHKHESNIMWIKRACNMNAIDMGIFFKEYGITHVDAESGIDLLGEHQGIFTVDEFCEIMEILEKGDEWYAKREEEANENTNMG